MSSDNQWHLSKSVPITLILALVLQSCAAVWWASSIDNKVSSLEEKLTDIDSSLNEENLRQWSRINSAEDLARQSMNQDRVTTAILERLEVQVADLREEIKETNDLLREQYEQR